MSTGVSWTEDLRQRSAEFAAQGLCVACGLPAEPGRKRCWEHLAYSRRRMAAKRKKWKRLGLCIRCGKQPPAQGRAVCAPCEEYTQIKNRERYQRQARVHSIPQLCGVPGASKFSGDWDEVNCETCLHLAGREL